MRWATIDVYPSKSLRAFKQDIITTATTPAVATQLPLIRNPLAPDHGKQRGRRLNNKRKEWSVTRECGKNRQIAAFLLYIAGLFLTTGFQHLARSCFSHCKHLCLWGVSRDKGSPTSGSFQNKSWRKWLAQKVWFQRLLGLANSRFLRGKKGVKMVQHFWRINL